MDSTLENSALVAKKIIPAAPPLPSPVTSYGKVLPLGGRSCVPAVTKDLWDRLFDEGYNADVIVNTDHGGKIYAHSSILVSIFVSDINQLYYKIVLVIDKMPLVILLVIIHFKNYNYVQHKCCCICRHLNWTIYELKKG